MIQWVTAGLALLLFGLGLTAAITARRRRNAERACVAAPESSLTIRLLEDFEGEGSMQDPARKVGRGPPLA
jgi:hypothetical protein